MQNRFCKHPTQAFRLYVSVLVLSENSIPGHRAAPRPRLPLLPAAGPAGAGSSACASGRGAPACRPPASCAAAPCNKKGEDLLINVSTGLAVVVYMCLPSRPWRVIHQLLVPQLPARGRRFVDIRLEKARRAIRAQLGEHGVPAHRPPDSRAAAACNRQHLSRNSVSNVLAVPLQWLEHGARAALLHCPPDSCDTSLVWQARLYGLELVSHKQGRIWPKATLASLLNWQNQTVTSSGAV